MNLESIITRITDGCPSFKLVDGAAEFMALAGKPRALPACYVLPLSETAGEDEGFDASYQRVTAAFAVLIAVGNVSDASGRAGLADIAALRLEVRAALLGWTPLECDLPAAYARGDLMDLKPGLLWWQDTWRTAYPIESN